MDGAKAAIFGMIASDLAIPVKAFGIFVRYKKSRIRLKLKLRHRLKNQEN
jgi:hypothetical protein